jgi:hypothetical protein
MKFSNSTGFRFGRPKYSRLTARLYCIAGACFLLSWLIGQPVKEVKEWTGGIGWLAVGAAMIVFLAGMIAERKEWQAAHKIDDSK